MIVGLSDGILGASLLAGIVGLGLNWRYRSIQLRENGRLQAEMDRRFEDCLGKITRVGEALEESQRNAQASLELLGDGRLSANARSRALRILRSGMSSETAAGELGMARNEVRLLQKVAEVLAPRS